jgi:hypothetical protein
MAQPVLLLFVTAFLLAEGFRHPYDPSKSRHYKASESDTFEDHPNKKFLLHYADTTRLGGFTGTDVVNVSVVFS